MSMSIMTYFYTCALYGSPWAPISSLTEDSIRPDDYYIDHDMRRHIARTVLKLHGRCVMLPDNLLNMAINVLNEGSLLDIIAEHQYLSEDITELIRDYM